MCYAVYVITATTGSVDLHREETILHYKTKACNGRYGNEIAFCSVKNATIQYLWHLLLCRPWYKTPLRSQKCSLHLQQFIAALSIMADFSPR
jgi:hypothetical protein